MTKNELMLQFNGRPTNELVQILDKYNEELANMLFVEDMATVLEAKEVIETILEERNNGTK